MEKYIWGRITWYMFHTLAAKIRPELFSIYRSVLINFVVNISYNLPCPICAEHARTHLKRVNFQQIQTKQQFREFVFAFHNQVNRDTGKPIAPLSVIDKYDSANVDKMLSMFIDVHNHESFSNKLMMRKHMKNHEIQNFVNWYFTNKHAFES